MSGIGRAANPNVRDGWFGISQRRRGGSTEKSLKSAKRHFDIFLGRFLSNPTNAATHMVPLFGSADCPMENRTYDNACKGAINDRIIDHFGTYLHDEATNQRLIRAGVQASIRWECASRYLSAIANDVRKCFLYNMSQCPISDNTMTQVRQGMLNSFVDRCIKNNESLSNSREDGSEEDLLRIIALCLWDNSFDCANLAAFVDTLFQMAGRGVEIACLDFNRISLYQPEEFSGLGLGPCYDKVAKNLLWRSKTVVEQNLSIFNHRECFLEDWYFLLAYSMIMNEQPSPSNAMFPKFKKKSDNARESIRPQSSQNADTEDPMQAERDAVEEEEAAAANSAEQQGLHGETRQTKAVSTYFKDMLKYLLRAASQLESPELDEDEDPTSLTFLPHGLVFNGNITTHSWKRYHVRKATSHSSLSLPDVFFRCGWKMKAAHTLFDYLNATEAGDRQVARVNSGWTSQVDGKYIGGRPPELRALIGDPDYNKVYHFVNALFQSYESVDGAKDKEFQSLLASSILLYLRDFLLFLQEHPQNRFGSTNETCFESHRFLEKLKYAASVAGIEDPLATLERWSQTIERDFTKRNYHAMPFYKVVEVTDGEVFECDTRPLATQMNELRSFVNSLECRQSAVEQKVATSIQKMNGLGEELTRLGSQINRIETMMIKLVNCQFQLSQTNNGNGADDEGSNIGSRTNDTCKHLSMPTTLKGMHPKDLFLAWHIQGYYASERRDNKNSRQTYNNGRFCAEYFQLFLEKQVPPLPDGVVYGSSPQAKDWREELKELTELAWSKYETLFQKECPGKGIQESVSTFKEWMYHLDSKKWPEGPNEPSHFNLRTKKFLVENQRTQRGKQEKNQQRKRQRNESESVNQNQSESAEIQANDD